MHFNSQPHKEADKREVGSIQPDPISTHSLTRRLTSQSCKFCVRIFISTHSLTRRLTGERFYESTNKNIFQLTASQGGWQVTVLKMLEPTIYFNSQPHKEADAYQKAINAKVDAFQLTASQGGWHLTFYALYPLLLFQLTASQGGWRDTHGRHEHVNHFNSQPHKEADDTGEYYEYDREEFQLTASQGGWHFTPVLLSFDSGISTHSLTRRLTFVIGTARDILGFQLTASQGGWLAVTVPTFPFSIFQLTASQGGWRVRGLISNDG